MYYGNESIIAMKGAWGRGIRRGERSQGGRRRQPSLRGFGPIPLEDGDEIQGHRSP